MSDSPSGSIGRPSSRSANRRRSSATTWSTRAGGAVHRCAGPRDCSSGLIRIGGCIDDILTTMLTRPRASSAVSSSPRLAKLSYRWRKFGPSTFNGIAATLPCEPMHF